MPMPIPSPARRALAAGLGIALSLVAIAAPPAHAFKPYTHVYAAELARKDAADGSVVINGVAYPVDSKLVAALNNYPSYYNGGVVGPDGFPDLLMGQAVIHPESTGVWLRFLHRRALDAQSDPRYTDAQRAQILAFARGFLNHASGDMWAHTMVNEFARGVFPGVKTIITVPDSAAIALRHIVVEGYIGDATPGFDANPECSRLPNGDISDDSTPEVALDVPTQWTYETLVQRNNGSPDNQRGVAMDYFYDVRADLQAKLRRPNPDPIAPLVGFYEQAKANVEFLKCSCDPDCENGTSCIEAIVQFLGDIFEGGFDAALKALGLVVDAAVDAVVDAYMTAWLQDIDEGLQAWPELGLHVSRALFDPETRRYWQNEDCKSIDQDAFPLERCNCEKAVGQIDVLFREIDPFINDHLLSMAGAPDFVGGLRAALQEAADFLSGVMDYIFGPALNPIRNTLAEIKKFIQDLLFDFIKQNTGFDLRAMKEFLSSPSSKMDLTSVDLTLPGGQVASVSFFRPGDHEKLDRYLGIGPDHHAQIAPGVNGGLRDDVEFDQEKFAAFRNAVTMCKLVMLDGTQLDKLMSDLVGQPVVYYASDPYANILTVPLSGSDYPDAWLHSIDGDHSWRADSRPIFTNPAHLDAGKGNFPLWESCVLRERAFRALFLDWENGDEQFPELDDAASTDPNDLQPPVSSIGVGTPKHAASGLQFVTSATQLDINAADDFWPVGDLHVNTRIRSTAATIYGPATLDPGSPLFLSSQPDGDYRFDLDAFDPCQKELQHTFAYRLDNTAPLITYQQPALAQYDTDDSSSIVYLLDDGPGSGVASSSVTLDGAPATPGQLLDMFFFSPAEHIIVVSAADHLGNARAVSRTFRVRATTQSMLASIDRAYSLGQIRTRGAWMSLRAKIRTALQAHDEGRHDNERNHLEAAIHELRALECAETGTTVMEGPATVAGPGEIAPDESTPDGSIGEGASPEPADAGVVLRAAGSDCKIDLATNLRFQAFLRDLIDSPETVAARTPRTPTGGGPIAYSGVGEPSPGGALEFRLRDGEPNPFSRRTAITFSLSEAGRVSLAVYDVAGRKIRTLVETELVAGQHSFVWNGTDDQGRTVPLGVYTCRLESGSRQATRRVVRTSGGY